MPKQSHEHCDFQLPKMDFFHGRLENKDHMKIPRQQNGIPNYDSDQFPYIVAPMDNNALLSVNDSEIFYVKIFKNNLDSKIVLLRLYSI